VKQKHLFKIPFKGLKVGKHEFDFDTDDSFFEEFEGSEINKGKVHTRVVLEKSNTLMELHFELHGLVLTLCDRCLDDLEIAVDYKTSMYVKFGDETEEQTDEIIILSHNEHELDVAQYIYEFINLSMPYKRVHPDDPRGKSTCNKEMLENLDKYLLRGKEQETDPRWNDLRNLMNNN
jgi:uncharacterized protein